MTDAAVPPQIRKTAGRNPVARTLLELYEALLAHFGPQQWWPARTKFEVIIGAILTQNTNWQNVEKAIANLRASKALSAEALWHLWRAGDGQLAERIRPSGYFNVKAARLGSFLDWFMCECGGSLRRMGSTATEDLRAQLLSIKGIGPETADSILLYALGRPVFVIDAYTRRIVRRHRIARGDEPYDELRALFEDHLPRRTQLYNEFHALIVAAGKHHCRPTPLCSGCPLEMHPHTTGHD